MTDLQEVAPSQAGYIKLHRVLQDNFLWEDDQDPRKLKWWIDILFTVNYSTSVKTLGGFRDITCTRGQSILSQKSWAKRWKVDISTVRRYFALLERQGMITLEVLPNTTRLTVCNYETYNDVQHPKQTGDKPETNRKQTGSKTTKEGKEGKEGKEYNTGAGSFETFWETYAKKQGDKQRAARLWKALHEDDHKAIMAYIAPYRQDAKETKYMLHPDKFLAQERWKVSLNPLFTTPVSTKRRLDDNETF